MTKGDAPLMRYIAAASGPTTVVAGGFAANKLLAESGHQPWKGGDVDVFVYNATYLNDTQHVDAASLWLFPRQEKAVAFATHFFQTLGYHVEEVSENHVRYPDQEDVHGLESPHVARLAFSRAEVAGQVSLWLQANVEGIGRARPLPDLSDSMKTVLSRTVDNLPVSRQLREWAIADPYGAVTYLRIRCPHTDRKWVDLLLNIVAIKPNCGVDAGRPTHPPPP